jgi:hypothetical protein
LIHLNTNGEIVRGEHASIKLKSSRNPLGRVMKVIKVIAESLRVWRDMQGRSASQVTVLGSVWRKEQRYIALKCS